MPVELRCLGPLEVRVNGGAAPAELLWRKHLALLVYLVRAPRGKAREHLIGLLWPDKDQDKARHSLNEALRVLRRTLGDALVTDGDTVRVQPGAVSTDIEPMISDQVAGPFLEGFSVPDAPEFEDWLGRERDAVRVAVLQGLLADGARLLAEGLPRSARELATRALTLDAHHEPAIRLVMRAYALEGIRQLALETYDRAETELRRDLGAQLDAETRALANRLRAGEVVPLAARGVAPDQIVPLVGAGRTALARLVALWADAHSGPRVALLRGDPGTGKTRLMDELAARARLDGAVVVSARGLEGDSRAAVWTAWVRGGLAVPEIAAAPGAALAALAELDPDIAVRFPGARAAAPLPREDAFIAAVEAIAAARPVLLVLDDAHRADSTAVDAVARVAQRTSAPILALLAAPQTAVTVVDRLSERLGRDVQGLEIHTQTLSDADAAELARWALPNYDSAECVRLARRMMADTAGNPFLLVQLVLALQAGLRVRPGEGPAWPAARRTLDDTMPADLPPAVAAALRLRFRALSAAAQRALTAIAVLGGRAPHAVLAEAARLDPRELERALDDLERQRWLQGDANGYGFITALAREVILADMVTRGERRRLEERARIAMAQPQE